MTQVANQPSWIIDGSYLSAGEIRRTRADTIFWFALPRWACMGDVLLRAAGSYGRVRPETAAGCPERLDLEFLRYVCAYRAQQQRPRLLAFFEGLRPDRDFARFASRGAADSYLARLSSDPSAVGVR